MTLIDLANPTRFLTLTTRLLPWLAAATAILLAIGITAVLGPSTLDAILALAIVYIPRTARIVRSSVIVLREMGIPARRIAFSTR